MPIYEYEPEDRECLICNGRTEFMQRISDEPFKFCPTCGMSVKRVVSNVSFKIDKISGGKSAKKGFTTYKKSGEGVWQKESGEGADAIVQKRVPRPKKPKKINLD